MARKEDYEEYYDDYYEVDDHEEYEDYDDTTTKVVVKKKNDKTWIDILAFISTWFIRIGMVIAIILFIYFIITLKIGKALLFLIGLAVAFGFGYLFMCCLDWLTTNN
ncbi:MAG: hypothetical protein IJI22_03400 [Bacilli bacterium]|nr:hypothetical protein [Bacilli bacterium]